jgi:hypothetical protein
MKTYTRGQKARAEAWRAMLAHTQTLPFLLSLQAKTYAEHKLRRTKEKLDE